MARIRNKRRMGPLLKEMRTSPVAAVVNGVLGIGSILGIGILIVLRTVRAMKMTAPEPVRQATSQKAFLLYVGLVTLFLLVGAGFLLFALVQITTSIRVFSRGLVWCRFFRKRAVLWEEVAHFGPFDTETESRSSWSMLLRSGERIILHAGLYDSREFAATMELIAEEIKETQKQFG